jgi:hypothetical protein
MCCPDDADQYQRADFYMHVMLPLPAPRDRQVISVSENHTQAQVAAMDYASKVEQIVSVCSSSLPQPLPMQSHVGFLTKFWDMIMFRLQFNGCFYV